jgi:hypothetical protein
VCVIQIKPLLEKLLKLPNDSLTKEIQLSQVKTSLPKKRKQEKKRKIEEKKKNKKIFVFLFLFFQVVTITNRISSVFSSSIKSQVTLCPMMGQKETVWNTK